MTFRFDQALVMIALIAMISFPLTAQDQPDVSLASIDTQLNRVEWRPNIDVALSLRVALPDGSQFSETFEPGTSPVFTHDDVGLTRLPEGLYSWELKAVEADTKDRGDEDTSTQSSESEEPEERRATTRRPIRSELTIQSGHFTVQDGMILNPRLREPSSSALVTGGNDGPTTLADPISGDLTIYNSLCVGFDCASNESFGSDTIRLKENNLRIDFEDTSVAPFPDHDWRLIANESGSGQLNKFSIINSTVSSTPFTIEGGSPSHSLYVDDRGNLGLGTSTPSVEAHAVDGDTPTLRLEQDASSGFTPQTWDVAGNETNFFVRDATNGSRLPFRIRPSAPSNSIFIDTDGDVGIGTASPDGRLHVVGTDSPRVRMEDTVDNANDKPGLAMKSPASEGGGEWRFETDNAGNFQIDYSLSAGPEMVLIDSPGSNSMVKINGDLVVQGACTGCDAVFEAGYALESIEEHASQMWENSYLPAVGPTPEGETSLNVFEKTTGILQELEKAHIYIEQLHRDKVRLENELAEVKLMLRQILDEK